MPVPPATREALVSATSLLFVLCVAAAVRLNEVASVATFQDSVGPFWAAIRLDGRTHAAPYGAAMLFPYVAIGGLADSLWAAICGLGWVHALVAPIAWVHVRGLDSKRKFVGILIAGLVALDPGLIDTFRSGAECYLAPLGVGLAAVVVGPWAWVAFGFSIANHPLALAAFPLLLRKENLDRKAAWGIAVFVVLVGQQAVGWNDAGVTGWGVGSALGAYLTQGSLAAVAVLAAPFVGLFDSRTRPLAGRVLFSFLILGLMGGAVGYLRDHHIRMLTVPALVCWLAAPGRWIWLLVPVFFARGGPAMPPDVRDRPGTLGLTQHIGDLLGSVPRPLVVDRFWVSGGPAVEPSAVMLDLFLRGDVAADLTVEGEVVTIVAADNEQLLQLGHPGTLLLQGHGFYVSHSNGAATRSWSSEACDLAPKVGGAWDAISVLHPELATTDVGAWWACP